MPQKKKKKTALNNNSFAKPIFKMPFLGREMRPGIIFI
jgi:hypothetical protein